MARIRVGVVVVVVCMCAGLVPNSRAQTPAFRYQRAGGAAAPQLTLAVARFADARVLAAVAESADATTMVTAEGRALTEIRLRLVNRAQPFMKVALPPGAAIVSVDVAGMPAKPVTGADGTRVPLLRAGLASGDLAMTLPALDVPVVVMHWEVFVPEHYKTRIAGGNVVEAHVFYAATTASRPDAPRTWTAPPPRGRVRVSVLGDGSDGQVRGVVRDHSGIVLPGVTLELRGSGAMKSAVTAADGSFVFANLTNGNIALTAALTGFVTESALFLFDGRPRRVDFDLEVAALTETITVTAEAPDASSDRRAALAEREPEPPSRSVPSLQQRAAGVLPIRIDVPRAGRSYAFIRPLVVNEDTEVTLHYTRR